MPLREAFYLGAACQIGATVRLSGPADKSAALIGASRLDPCGALRPRINRAEALRTSPLNRARVRAGLATSVQTEHPKSEFSGRGAGRCARNMAVSPPERPQERFSHPGRGLAPPQPAFARYARSGEAEFSATPAAASAGVMKNSRAMAGGPPGGLAAAAHQVMSNSHKWPVIEVATVAGRRVMKNSHAISRRCRLGA